MIEGLDLFCGEGGASAGYASITHIAMTGVDKNPAPLKRYPYDRVCKDWQAGLRQYMGLIDFIHASPPCQVYSGAVSTAARIEYLQMYDGMIDRVRDCCWVSGKPYIIENVPGAPLRNPVELCGCMFGLGAKIEGKRFALYRPRLFETSFPLAQPKHKEHVHPALPVFGHSPPSWFYRKYGHGVPVAMVRKAMGSPWMSREGLRESIPPAFTQYIASGLLSALGSSMPGQLAR